MTELSRSRRRMLAGLPALWPALLPALLAALAGCTTVGPDHQAPVPALDPAFIAAGSTSAPDTGPVPEDIARFWQGFNDARLTSLVDRALTANHDLRIARARLQEARAGLDEADAAQRPGIGLEANAGRSVAPITQQPGASRSNRTGNSFDAGFLAAWEIDLFGGNRRASEAAAALTDASAASLHAIQTSVVAEVVRNDLVLRGLQARLKFTEDSLLNQRASLRISRARADVGRGTALDLAQARSLVAATEAALPVFQNTIERTVFRLATLTAQPPAALLSELTGESSVHTPLPTLPVTDLSDLPLGTPQQWLQRRPDLRAAERELAAATAGIGVATSALYPRLSLTGLLGLNAASLGALGDSASARYALGAGLSWTPFDTGAVRARIRASEARATQSLARFDQAVATALEETEGALSSFTRYARRTDRLAEAAQSAEEVASLARKRYDAGVTDFAAVLDAERVALGQRDQWVQAQVDTATALVNVYRALGGGWATGTAPGPAR